MHARAKLLEVESAVARHVRQLPYLGEFLNRKARLFEENFGHGAVNKTVHIRLKGMGALTFDH